MSDAGRFRVRAGEHLAISLYAVAATGTPSVHGEANQRNHIGRGNLAGAEGMAYTDVATAWYFLPGVEVAARPDAKSAIVTAEGVPSSPPKTRSRTARHRPSIPSAATPTSWRGDCGKATRLSLVGPDAGYGGSRLLNDSPCFGSSLLPGWTATCYCAPACVR